MRPSKTALDRESRFLRVYIEDIHKRPLLSLEQEKELALRARRGDVDALQRLVEGNLRFVVMIANEYRDAGLPLSDLINEGNLGLLEAARRYDVTRGVKFISYAVWWIRQSILQALAKYNRTVRIPVNHVWAVRRAAKVSDRLKQELGRDPSIDEIAEAMNVAVRKLHSEVTQFHPGSELSLEQPVGVDSDMAPIDWLAAPEDLASDDSPEEEFRRELDDVLGTLEPREAEIVRMFFGIGYERPYTLVEIGDALGISRERVRQLKNRALVKLRHGARRNRLRVLLG
jgi:RNA polymerase primary sigma factor